MYKSEFISSHFESRSDMVGCVFDLKGGPAVFRRDASMPEGLFEVHLVGYAVVPIDKFRRLREPLWFRFKRWLTGDER